MRNTPDEGVPPERIRIDGIDQQKARAAWAKLHESHGVVEHALHTFYCTEDLSDGLNKPHFNIAVLPPNSDPDTATSLIDINLVQEKDGSFSVIQDKATDEFLTPLTAGEVHVLLDQIATSARNTVE